MDPHSHTLSSIDLSRYYFFQVAPHPDPLLLRTILVMPGIEPGTSGSVARNSGSTTFTYNYNI
jgi:hypothetical protein